VRIPASNCGIWGWRPSHGIISVAGVMPFSPTLDTVGVFTRSAELLERVAAVLLGAEEREVGPDRVDSIYVVREAFELAEGAVRESLQPSVDRLQEALGRPVAEKSLRELCSDDRAADLTSWLTIYRVLQGTEFQSTLGSWIADASPAVGPALVAGLEFVKKLDRTRIGESVGLRENFARRLNDALASGDLLCFPTVPTPAPLKGSKAYDRSNDYYWRTLSINAIAGVGRLPQVSMPLGQVEGAPVGLSLLAGYGRDMELLAAATQIAKQLQSFPVQLQ
jgi:amidase